MSSSESSAQQQAIPVEVAKTLDGLFRERVKRTPQAIAYRNYEADQQAWRDFTWEEMAGAVACWRAALSQENLVPGDRVAVMLRNSPQWVMFEQAALASGLVVVPLYSEDRAENAAWCLEHAGVKLLLLENQTQWQALREVQNLPVQLTRIIIVESATDNIQIVGDSRVCALSDWLSVSNIGNIDSVNPDPHALATLIYTSGTTGRPKGVMLSHHNILSNAYGSAQVVTVTSKDLLLSFLPLSHTFERTAGYYVPMLCGATVVYARSIRLLQEDLPVVRPTILVSVPRVYEKIYAGIQAKLEQGSALAKFLFNLAVTVGYSRFEYRQGRASWRLSHLLWPLLEKLVARKVMAKLGGRLQQVMSGGAALSSDISRVFVGLGLPILQGYGLTETSPVTCANRLDDNLPSSVGKPIPGVEVRLNEQSILLIHGPNVMLGYWQNLEATHAVLSEDGWFNSGDTARIDERGHVTITGRIKDIIVTSTGEKIPPADMEAAILRDPIFEQIMVIGEGRSYLSVLAVLSGQGWKTVAAQCNVENNPEQLVRNDYAEEIVLEKIARQISGFPGYAKIHRAALITEPWSVENEMLTPTLKIKRAKILEQYRDVIENLYADR